MKDPYLASIRDIHITKAVERRTSDRYAIFVPWTFIKRMRVVEKQTWADFSTTALGTRGLVVDNGINILRRTRHS